jgi:hypothetical protein
MKGVEMYANMREGNSTSFRSVDWLSEAQQPKVRR